MDQHSNFRFTVTWMREAHRVLAPGAYVGIFCDWRQLPVFTDALQIADFHWHGICICICICIWDKTEEVRPTKGISNMEVEPGAQVILSTVRCLTKTLARLTI